VSALLAVLSSQSGFSLNQPFGALDDPSPDLKFFAGRHVLPEPDPEFTCERFAFCSRNGFRHGLIEHRAENAAMHNAAKSFPILCGGPTGCDDAILGKSVPDPEPMRMVLAADDTTGLDLYTECPGRRTSGCG
jgi:hypothetical protein